LANLYCDRLLKSISPNSAEVDLGDINHYFRYAYISHLKIGDMVSSTALPISIDKISISDTGIINNLLSTQCTITTGNFTNLNCTTLSANQFNILSLALENLTISDTLQSAKLNISGSGLISNLIVSSNNTYDCGSDTNRFKIGYFITENCNNLIVNTSLILPNLCILNQHVNSIDASKLCGFLDSDNIMEDGKLNGTKIKANSILRSQLNLLANDIDLSIINLVDNTINGSKLLTNSIPISKLDTCSGSGMKVLFDDHT